MNDLSDADLLNEFARNDSEAAFAVLVERYLGLVHSVALRQTNDPQHAQDISQAVFIILARKAGVLDSKTVLPGWLYHTARLTAANFQRAEWRRARREQEAFMQSNVNGSSSDLPWRELCPHLETAMAQLVPADRDALVMRYFQNRSMADVGTALGWTENTAQKRVGRALEKLRKCFGKRGITLTVGVIAASLSANAVQAAPTGLAKAITAVAVTKGATASISTVKLVKATLKLLLWSNLTFFIPLMFLSVSSAIGAGVVSSRLMSDALKREDQGASPPTEFLDRHNYVELRKKYSKQFRLFVLLMVVLFFSSCAWEIWSGFHPDAAARWEPWRNVARFAPIGVFLIIAAVLWRVAGGASGWRARILRRNDMIIKQLWEPDPNPAMPAHYDDDSFNTNFKQAGLVSFIPLLGVLVMVAAWICMFRKVGGWKAPMIFLAGMALAVIGKYLTVRKVRRGWLLTDARYIKHVMKYVATGGGGGGSGGGGGYSCIVICEYEYAGVKYRVTPKVTPVAIVTLPAKVAERHLMRRISPDGTCKLHFNPENPLEATLYGGGLIDRFLVSHP
jgi:RNA polymerase sigma factor (sigma-70 family)